MTRLFFAKKYLHLTDPPLLSAFCQKARLIKAAKGTLLARIGEPQNDLAFLVSGLARAFLPGPKGKDSTDHFIFQPGTALLSTFDLERSPALVSVEALEDCSFYTLPITEIQEILTDLSQTDQIYPHLMHGILTDIWATKFAFQKFSTIKGRYRWFIQTYPDLAGRVQQKHIASFLGTTPENLSRIRASLPF